jgi:hypothetical protein
MTIMANLLTSPASAPLELASVAQALQHAPASLLPCICQTRLLRPGANIWALFRFCFCVNDLMTVTMSTANT